MAKEREQLIAKKPLKFNGGIIQFMTDRLTLI
jgi:hypothetical protein